jgi:outer membrane receptor protein involved in Fe transport
MLGMAVALAAPGAWAGADGGVPDDTLAPLIENGSGQPPASSGTTPGTPPAPGRPVTAAPAEPDDTVMVQVPTRGLTALEWAPSVVTVLGREDLQALGYRTLNEVLRNAAGFDVNDDGAWVDIGTRGLNANGTHGGMLRVMVDGHDMAWRQFGWNLVDRSWVDLDDVERIEIVRGPTAAVWGSGGVGGAINVVTRDWTKLKGAEGTFGVVGALDGQFASARVGGVVGDVSLYGSFSYDADDADPALPPLREFLLISQTREVRVEGERQEAATVNLKARWRDFEGTLWHGRSDLGSPLFPLSVLGGDQTRLISNRTVARLSWSRELLPALKVRGELALDQIAFDPGTVYENQPGEMTPGSPAFDVAGNYLRKIAAFDRRTEGHAEMRYAFSDVVRAAGGLDVEWLSAVQSYFPELFAQEGLAEPRLNDLHLGAWADAQFHVFEMMELSASARYNLDQLSGSTVMPRAAAVLHLPADVYVKGLYGSGYREPSIQELRSFRKSLLLYGNPALSPETSLTGELEIGYAPGSLRVSVVGFLTRVNGLIGYGDFRQPGTPLEGEGLFPVPARPDPGAAYRQLENQGFVTTAGAELDVRFEPVPALALQAQASLRRPRDASDQRLPYSAEWIAGASAVWHPTRTLTTTLRVLATGDRPVPATALMEPGFPMWAADADPTTSAPASVIATAVVRANLSEKVALELKLDNVTDTWWYDAGPAVLYPQRRFQVSAWLSASL